MSGIPKRSVVIALVLAVTAVALLGAAASARAVNASYHGVDFISAAKGWAVGRNATIVRTTDGGRTWTRQHYESLGPVLLDINVNADGLHGWAVGTGGTVLRTVNGGRTWVKVTGFGTVPDPSADLSSVRFVGLSKGWVCGGYPASPMASEMPWGGVWSTTDGGRTWSAPAATFANWCPVALDASNAWTLTAAGVMRGVAPGPVPINVPSYAQTTDGTYWGAASQPLDGGLTTVDVNDLDQAAGGRIVVVGRYPDLVPQEPYAVTSGNGGLSFSSVTLPAGSPVAVNGVKMVSNLVGYAVGLGSSAALKTTNGGLTWRVKSTALGRNLQAVDFVNATTGYAVGLRASTGAPMVIKTTNGARTWTRVK